MLALFKAGMTQCLTLIVVSGVDFRKLEHSFELCQLYIGRKLYDIFATMQYVNKLYGYSMHNRLLNAQVTLSRTSIAVRNGVKRGYPVAGQGRFYMETSSKLFKSFFLPSSIGSRIVYLPAMGKPRLTPIDRFTNIFKFYTSLLNKSCS